MRVSAILLWRTANYVVSKSIVERYPHALIGLEHLKAIRERTKRRTGKRASQKQRKTNAQMSTWSLAELHAMLASKALRQGSMTIHIDANSTSQACPVWAYLAKE